MNRRENENGEEDDILMLFVRPLGFAVAMSRTVDLDWIYPPPTSMFLPIEKTCSSDSRDS
jgi:hypothetical protein